MTTTGTRAEESFWRRWAPWFVLAVVLIIALAVGARSTGEASLADRTRAVAATLRCPECTDKSMAASDAPTSIAGRTEIRKQLIAGRTPDEIRAWFADRYGRDILLTPSKSGVEGLIWAIPVAAFVVASILFGGMFWQWSRREVDVLDEADEQLVSAARSQRESTGDD